MSYGHDEGPVYYREIQKNAYLKRIPNETSGNKLIPLGHKVSSSSPSDVVYQRLVGSTSLRRKLSISKPPLKPMWTQFCVHNGRQPYLEQYPLAESPGTMSHKPTWRACLKTARHVTASVKPHVGQEYDFLVDTDEGPVRMLAPDWESMQDWVLTLRTKLHELRVLSAGENVYCSPPAPPAPRAAARDPTSPLPPTPPHPPDRVPGIELTTPIVTPRPEPVIEPAPQQEPEPEIDISSWEDTPSTSQEQNMEIRKSETNTKSVAKICGQNICLDDSVLKRNTEPTDSDEEFFNEIDRISDSVENIDFDYKQTLVVTDRQGSEDGGGGNSDRQATNVTVIQVSNKGPPHTAIPILGSEVNVFDFNFQNPESNSKFVNIVNTEVNVNNENGYGTVFSKESDYGHLSLTTTVNVTRECSTPAVTVTDVKVTDTNGVYERLCLASTSNEAPVAKVKNVDRSRKSSLPNLDSNGQTTYECLFPNENSVTVTENNFRNATVTENNVRNATVTENSVRNATVTENCVRNASVTENSVRNAPVTENSVRNATVTVNNERRENDRSQVVSPVVANLSSNTRVIRSNVERSHSQNAYDTSPRMREHLYRRVQNNSPKREVKTDKTESTQPKPIWKRGLTELSLLTRLRGIGQGKRHESPTRQEQEPIERSVTSPVKVVHRSRPEARADNNRRRSSSLSNGHPPGGGLIPLRRRQALALQADQSRRAAIPTTVPTHSPPLFVDYDNHIWIAWWGAYGSRCNGRVGDRLASVLCNTPRDAHHARQIMHATHAPHVDILFHRVPLGKIYVINKRDQESIGIKLDNECNIVSVERGSPAARCGLAAGGSWAVTEINNRSLNLLKGGDEELKRISLHGTEVSILLQPSPLVKKLRAAIKANKTLLSKR